LRPIRPRDGRTNCLSGRGRVHGRGRRTPRPAPIVKKSWDFADPASEALNSGERARKVTGRGEKKVLRLKINHKERIIEGDLDPATPLLWVLRDHLALVGTKFGCGAGYCGACTVHVNGAAVRAADLTGVEITTIEGLAQPDGTLHPLQVAWIENDVPQCGYCQAGQIMSAAALLTQKPRPSDADIDQFMNGNLCRCGCYRRIREAIHSAARAGDNSPAGGQQHTEVKS
jgi:isoquinoline 1-oxidoreductase subunit alpha